MAFRFILCDNLVAFRWENLSAVCGHFDIYVSRCLQPAKGSCCVYICLYTYLHAPTHTPRVFCINAWVYGYAGWDTSLIQTGVWIQHHHAGSAPQLPAGVHLCWAPTIWQGNSEACTLLCFSCPSTPPFLQQGATMVSSTPTCRVRGSQNLCDAGAGFQMYILGYRGCTCAVKDKREGTRASSRPEPLPLLSFSLGPVS